MIFPRLDWNLRVSSYVNEEKHVAVSKEGRSWLR
jgi:hypothetical protein